MIQELYKNILNKDDFSNIENFKYNNVAFEEIPLVNRYDNLKFLKTHFLLDDYSVFLLDVALFSLKNIFYQLKKSMSEKEYDDYFACITLCDPKDELEDVGFIVPNIFISSKSKVHFLSKATKINIQEDNFLNKIYSSLINDSMFSLYKTITKDGSDNIIRIYIVPSSH